MEAVGGLDPAMERLKVKTVFISGVSGVTAMSTVDLIPPALLPRGHPQIRFMNKNIDLILKVQVKYLKTK